ncbi:unnamed protein product [Ranitomeya imitator]|uniref:Uncharacterized protein n=1 Tax=Ranitomeya imitator TaxID=111125 RepID=A0ABN9LZK9_9NEOB|nr:unnamed protein product [Ranitomeya imitator]
MVSWLETLTTLIHTSNNWPIKSFEWETDKGLYKDCPAQSRSKGSWFQTGERKVRSTLDLKLLTTFDMVLLLWMESLRSAFTSTEKEQPALEEIKHTTVLPLPDAKEPSSVPAQAVFQPILPPEPPPSPPKPKFSDEDVAHVLEEILEDALKELSAPVIQSVSEYISNALSESSIVSDQLLADLVLNFSRNVAEEEIKAEIERVKEEKRRKAEEARKIQERERLLSLETQSQCVRLINDVVRENVQKVCKRELHLSNFLLEALGRKGCTSVPLVRHLGGSVHRCSDGH